MPNESSEIGSGFVKIFYGILLALAICAGMYAIVTPLVVEGGFFDTALNGVLNEIITEAVAMQQPPSDKGKRLKIFYGTQVSVKPPTFVLFVNDKELMHFSYTRYIENKIREAFGFTGTALRFITRERKEQ